VGWVEPLYFEAYFAGSELRIFCCPQLALDKLRALADWREIQSPQGGRMKPEFIPLKEPEVVTLNGRMFVIVGGTRRSKPFEVRWWAFSILGDIVVLERTWFNFVDSTDKELHRPCFRDIVPQIKASTFQAAFELGRRFNQSVLEMNAHKGLFAF
jgi:hypothetical protein